MNDQDYELLSQYLDGELPAAAALELKQRLLQEPQLRAEYEAMRKVNRSVQQAFSSAASTEVPAKVARLLQPAPATALPGRQPRNAWGLAVAASLVAVCGLVLSQNWLNTGSAPVPGDILLSEALEQSQSRGDGWESLADGRQFRAVLSFPHKTGSWCREYLMAEDSGHSRGIACRTEGKWITHISVPGQEPGNDSADQYRPAGAASPDVIGGFMSDYAGDIPLDASQEAALIAEGWD